MKQKRVFITVGIHGSGKSTFIKKQIENYGGIHISRDKIRFSMLKPEDEYFKVEEQVFNAFIEQIQNAIDNYDEEDVYVDATNISSFSRKKLISRINIINVKEIVWLYFNVPVETALERNSLREGRALVPEEVILSMSKNLTEPIAVGFFKVWIIDEEGDVVNVK